MDSLIGIKELYDVTIRLRQPMEIGNRKFSINEPILTFKTAEIAQIGDTKSRKKAKINRNYKTYFRQGGLY